MKSVKILYINVDIIHDLLFELHNYPALLFEIAQSALMEIFFREDFISSISFHSIIVFPLCGKTHSNEKNLRRSEEKYYTKF